MTGITAAAANESQESNIIHMHISDLLTAAQENWRVESKNIYANMCREIFIIVGEARVRLVCPPNGRKCKINKYKHTKK